MQRLFEIQTEREQMQQALDEYDREKRRNDELWEFERAKMTSSSVTVKGRKEIMDKRRGYAKASERAEQNIGAANEELDMIEERMDQVVKEWEDAAGRTMVQQDIEDFEAKIGVVISADRRRARGILPSSAETPAQPREQCQDTGDVDPILQKVLDYSADDDSILLTQSQLLNQVRARMGFCQKNKMKIYNLQRWLELEFIADANGDERSREAREERTVEVVKRMQNIENNIKAEDKQVRALIPLLNLANMQTVLEEERQANEQRKNIRIVNEERDKIASLILMKKCHDKTENRILDEEKEKLEACANESEEENVKAMYRVRQEVNDVRKKAAMNSIKEARVRLATALEKLGKQLDATTEKPTAVKKPEELSDDEESAPTQALPPGYDIRILQSSFVIDPNFPELHGISQILEEAEQDAATPEKDTASRRKPTAGKQPKQ